MGLLRLQNNGFTVADENWDDFRLPFAREKQGQADKPDFDFTNIGLLFPQNDATEIVYVIVQLPHAYKLESTIFPHYHYVQDEAGEPVCKMNYRWYLQGGDPTIGFTNVTFDDFVYTYVSGSLAQAVGITGGISGSGKNTKSSVLEIKFYRDDNIVAGDILAKELDIHYQVDGAGSDAQQSKSY